MRCRPGAPGPRISPASMKLSCSTNSPGAYADTRARRRACTNGARSSCLMPAPQAYSSRSLVRPSRRAGKPDDGVPRSARGTHEHGEAVRMVQVGSVTGATARTVQAGPVTGLIAQVALLATLAGTVGLGGRRLGRRSHVRTDHECGAGARPLPLPLRPARPGRLGDTRARHARRRGRGAGRRLVRPARGGRDARDAHGRRARAGRGRRLDRATHRHGVDRWARTSTVRSTRS